MAWVRQLPSGLWAATVYTPAGRITETHRLKGRVDDWARGQEDSIRRGNWIDPRAGKVTVGECWERWNEGRRQEKASRARDRSHWRNHVGPRWAKVQVGAILRPDVTAWVTEMEKAGVGADTIIACVGLLRWILDQAVDARLIPDNAARGVKKPQPNAHLDRVLDPSEDELLLATLDQLFPGRCDARLAVELLLYCGLRWEEMGGLDREHVDTRRAILHIGPILERDGTIRPYPKTRAGVRDVPVDRELWPRLRAHVLTVSPGGLIVTSAMGSPLDYSRWYARVWRKGLAAARLDDPQPTPHDLRHTYGTRLGEQNTPPHEIMSLMGHSSLKSVQRYLHPGDGRFDRAREAVERARMGL